MTVSTCPVYAFDEAPASSELLLGGKGAGLARMVAAGIPVPPGFILTTECGKRYLDDADLTPDLEHKIDQHLERLARATGRRFGDPRNPLLVSVRSGAPVSMPGMMDTVLNVGLTAESVETLAVETGDALFAHSSYEYLLEGFARTIRGIGIDTIEDAAPASPIRSVERSMERCRVLLNLIEKESETPFPDPQGQLTEAIGAVFRSWNSRRAKAYRRHRGIDDSLGTAVVIQTMVFGNRSDTSGSGVAFTRNPATGEPGSCGEFLFRAQGEDVVSGEYGAGALDDLTCGLPPTAAELEAVLRDLERTTKDMCDVEFTVENGQLWILQTRIGQRSGRAALRIAVDMAEEGLISRTEAVRRVEERGLESVATPFFPSAPDPDAFLVAGIAASPGAATGIAVFDPLRATELASNGTDVILIRPTTSPSDLEGLLASVAVVTGRGGPMSHAAVVARGMDRPAVCGVGDIVVATDLQSAVVAGLSVNEGDMLSVDGDRGTVARGALPLVPATEDERYRQFLEWRSEAQGPADLEAQNAL
ncbi:pyruvate, phosphate dikinase [Rhodococcus opacus]|uniref:pyruvate, phosphate dikinase n=1 Tax=Rhodococcus opacus TaxID=37919 RepID=UPI000A78E257|nr:pyruvate, phosphate dikinase [Rhodococcus opacus]